ncbi:MAG TPA: hypothetical protein VIZ31_12950, partial [Vicinamibacteria bacterium]
MSYDLIALGETMLALAPPAGETLQRAASLVVDHAGAEQPDSTFADAKLEKGDVFRLLDRGAVKKKILPSMLNKAQEHA